MATNVIDFQTHRLGRNRLRCNHLTAALAAYISELQADSLTLDTPLAVGAVLADVARMAGVEPPPQVQAWLDAPIG